MCLESGKYTTDEVDLKYIAHIQLASLVSVSDLTAKWLTA